MGSMLIWASLLLVAAQGQRPIPPEEVLRRADLKEWKVYRVVATSTPPFVSGPVRQDLAYSKLLKTLSEKEAGNVRGALLRLSIPAPALSQKLSPSIIIRFKSDRNAYDVLLDTDRGAVAITRSKSPAAGGGRQARKSSKDWLTILRICTPKRKR